MVKTSAVYVPERGDLVWLTFDPTAGREQRGRRPALVISPQSYNRAASLALCCPITSQVKGYPFEVRLPDKIEVSGVILVDQIKNLDWSVRRAKKICRLPNELLTEVLAKLKVLI